MSEGKYLRPGGKELLQKELAEADEPIEFINSLRDVEVVKDDDLLPFYSMLEAVNMTPSKVLDTFFKKEVTNIKSKIDSMSVEELKQLMNDFEPYSDLPEFQEVVKYLVTKLPKIPVGVSVPTVITASLKPEEQARLFVNQPNSFEDWLNDTFEHFMYDFEDGDDFGYLNLFRKISEIIFYKRQLVEFTNLYLENHFRESYHPIYSMTRFRIALFNSPISQIDPVRPLAIIMYQSFHGVKINKPNMDQAASIAGKQLAHMILSIPHVTLISNVQYYGEHFGVPHNDVKEFVTIKLEKPDRATPQQIGDSEPMARIAAIGFVQHKKLHPTVLKALSLTQPQIDVAMVMARFYRPEFKPLLDAWASRNPFIYIDYLTRIKASKLEMPQFDVRPVLTPLQGVIVNAIMSA